MIYYVGGLLNFQREEEKLVNFLICDYLLVFNIITPVLSDRTLVICDYFAPNL